MLASAYARTAIKSVLALSAWAAVHSLLATSRVKRRARARLGARRSDALYRLGYTAVAGLSLAVLVRYQWTLPDRRLYTVRGPLRAVMLGGQALSLLAVVAGGLRVGVGKFPGLTQAWEYVRGGPISPGPVSQHPPPKPGDDRPNWGGPYRLSRHPLNYFVLTIYWFSPVMTVKWAAVGVVTAVYMVLGSVHEGRLLLEAYGDRYLRYREEVPHFLVPVGRWLGR